MFVSKIILLKYLRMCRNNFYSYFKYLQEIISGADNTAAINNYFIILILGYLYSKQDRTWSNRYSKSK